MLSTRIRRALAAALVLTAAAACSSSGNRSASTTTTTGRPVPLGATFHAQAHWQGAVDLSGSYTVAYRSNDPKRNSCSGLAKPPKIDTNFVVPLPTNLAGYHVSAIATASAFRGAGEYATARFAGFHVTLTKLDSSDDRLFVTNPRTTVHLSVAADGSGAFEFENLADDSSASLSGTVRWTCR